MTSEVLWGAPVNENSFRIENIPLYAYNISYHDVARCSPLDVDSYKLDFVIVRGGHSTYRLLLRKGKDKSDFLRQWPKLEQLGCVYESSADPEDVFAIDVPPDTDVRAVYQILEAGEQDQLWYLDEGNFEHMSTQPE